MSTVLEDMARAILGSASRRPKASEHRAQVLRKDADGTYWVAIPGGASETPVYSVLAEVDPGDYANVTISNGKAAITANASSPAASTRTTSRAGAMAQLAYSTAYQEKARIDQLEATSLSAQVAYITTLIAQELTAQSLTAEQLAAATAYVAALTAGSVTAQNIIADHADFDDVKANAAKVTNLTAEQLAVAVAYIAGLRAADIEVANIVADHATIAELDVETLMATYLKANFSNIDTAHIDSADIQELFAYSGWFNNVTITGDEKITGQLKAVLIDGDTARLRNLFADSVNILGDDGLYHKLNLMGYDESRKIVYDEVTPAGTEDPSAEEWYVIDGGAYVPTEDTTVDSGTAYYTRHYSQVTPEGDEDPHEKGWYVISDGKHVLTEDTEVDFEQAYYEVQTEYSNAITKAYWDGYATVAGNSLDSGLHGSNIIAESVTAREIDVEDLTAKMLRTQNVVIGAQGGFHIEIDGTEIGFYQGNMKVAYVSNNELYIPRTVVLDSMRIGDWQWVRRQSGNLTLQWIGS